MNVDDNRARDRLNKTINVLCLINDVNLQDRERGTICKPAQRLISLKFRTATRKSGVPGQVTKPIHVLINSATNNSRSRAAITCDTHKTQAKPTQKPTQKPTFYQTSPSVQILLRQKGRFLPRFCYRGYTEVSNLPTGDSILFVKPTQKPTLFDEPEYNLWGGL